MPRMTIAIALCALLLLGACGGPEGPAPEDFALRVARCVAKDDWPAYRDLAMALSSALATDSNPTATRQTFRDLVSAEETAVRRDFDRAVAAGVVSAEALESYRAVVHATEPNRWVLHIQDSDGRFTGLEMTLVRVRDGYRVATLFPR